MMVRASHESIYPDDSPAAQDRHHVSLAVELGLTGPLEDVLHKPDHSLIDQSMHARMEVEDFTPKVP